MFSYQVESAAAILIKWIFIYNLLWCSIILKLMLVSYDINVDEKTNKLNSIYIHTLLDTCSKTCIMHASMIHVSMLVCLLTTLLDTC